MEDLDKLTNEQVQFLNLQDDKLKQQKMKLTEKPKKEAKKS